MTEYKTLEQRKKFYKSAAWRRLRKQILEQNNNECFKCKELGLVTLASESKVDIDHIKPLEEFPELALEPENLMPLCVRHHNEKEGRVFKGTKNRSDKPR